MKNYLYRLLCSVLILFNICCLVACTQNSNPSKINAETKNYYLRNGYVNFSITDDLLVETNETGAFVNFDDDTSMIKENTIVSIKPKSSDYIFNNYNHYVNFSSGEILSGIKINGREYSFSSKDFNNYKITSSIKIESIYSKFEIAGLCCLVNKNEIFNNLILNNIITLDDGISINNDYVSDYELFYVKLKNLAFSSINIISKNDFNNNVVFDYKYKENSKSADFIFELSFNKETYSAFAILKDEDGMLYLNEMQYNESLMCFTINNIKTESDTIIETFNLFFDINIEVSDEY